jgi:Zn-dependent protease
MSFYQIIFYVIQFATLVLALSVHEAAHAFAANRLGDPTARMLGRLSLNPMRHVDPIGTLLLPAIAIFTGFPLIGWAKPVPVNPYNLKDRKIDHAFIAAAGPGSNLAQAFVYTAILWLMEPLSAGLVLGKVSLPFAVYFVIYAIAVAGISINILLAVFNLIPVPPLDGGWIIGGILPDAASDFLQSIGRYGFIIVMVLVYSGFLRYVLLPVLDAFKSTFLPQYGKAIIGSIFGF